MTNKSVFRFAGLLFALALICTTCGWGRILIFAPVIIHSIPEGAEVYRTDGTKALGVTPFKASIFHASKTFEVRMDKFFTQPVVLTFDSAREVYVMLKPKPILVYSKPTAEIFAVGSDTPLGKTPLKVDVRQEDRNYVLKAEEYYDLEVTLGVSVDNPVVVELAHRPLITLNASQSDVDIYENGNLLSKAPVTTEIEQPRSFELRKEGYYNKTIDLTPEQTHELVYKTTLELTPFPIINIDVTPADAEVYIIGNDEPISKGSIKLTIEQETSFEVKADRYYTDSFTVEAKDQLAKVMLKPMPYVTIASDPSGAEVYFNGELLGTTPLERLIEEETPFELKLDRYLPQSVTLGSDDMRPVITLEKVPAPAAIAIEPSTPVAEEAESDGFPVGLIAGIAVAAIAVAGILIAWIKKGKK